VPLNIEDSMPGATCASCGERQEGPALTLGGSIVLCSVCAAFTADAIQNKLWRNQHASLSREEQTSELVVKFSTYTLDMLLNELVMETTRWFIGPLDANERRVATALLERLDTLGIARKVHCKGCEIWPNYRLCACPWVVPS
jgi:uncharacterized Zn finger protein